MVEKKKDETKTSMPKADSDLKMEVMKSADKDLKLYARFSKQDKR